jgi:hypothetical protein
MVWTGLSVLMMEIVMVWTGLSVLMMEFVMVWTRLSVLMMESSWLLGSRWPENFVITRKTYRVLKNVVSYFMF